jgi:glucose-1-phosphatase
VIKTIFFDLGNVIIPFDFRPAFARMAQSCSYPADEIPNRIRSTDMVQRFETGRMSGEQFVKEISELLGLKMSYGEFCDLWTGIFLREPLVPESMFLRLRAHHRLMLLSNTNPIHFEMIQANYPLLRQFHGSVLSYEVGAVKPSSKIFREAIARAECRPEECFFTDDLSINVEAARKHGIDAVQFESAQQIEKELEARGVRF